MSSKHFFVCGNTAKGFCNLFSTNIQPLSKIFILKGGPGTGKSTLMKKIGKELEKLGYDIEYIHCSADPDSLDGVLVPKQGVGIVDGTAPHVLEPKAPGAVEEYVNLGVSWDTEKLAAHTKEIIEIQEDIRKCYENAYAEFANALKVHDEWEKIYIANMNFSKANQLTEEVSDRLLGTAAFNKPSCVKHRFFGGSTPYGAMDFVENITGKITTRYFVKGRPGTGKSTMLKKILEDAQSRGIDVEVYHCGFDPDSLDMLLFPGLDLCIFDSTAPHEYFPSREGDLVIDVYAELVNNHTDEKYETELADILVRYKFYIGEGTAHLAKAKKYHDELEKYYIEATNFNIIDSIYEELYDKVKNYKKP